MSEPPPKIPVLGLPGGIVAYAVRRPDGTVRVDRRGRTKTDRVVLVRDPAAAAVRPGEPVPDVDPKDVRWAVESQTRLWSSISRRFTARNARARTLALVRAGVVNASVTVTDTFRLGDIRSFMVNDPWLTWHDQQNEAAQDVATQWKDRAAHAATSISDHDPGLRDALLAARGTEPLLPVLVYAAEDLGDGTSHDGPRAFSQAHFEHTKERDDVGQILLNAGASPDTLIALGLRRSPYIGLGGPLQIPESSSDPAVRLARFAGPVMFRADDPDLSVHLDGDVPLLLVENLQAAEAVCDHHPDIAVVWFAGQPSDATLLHIEMLAERASRVLIAPDADLGGVRIAARILQATGWRSDKFQVLDVGGHAHKPRERFHAATLDALKTLTTTPGRAGAFAQTVLERGYPVEQEATIRAAITTALANGNDP